MLKKTSFIYNFFKLEAAEGIVLLITTIFAIVIANSSWSSHYFNLINLKISIQIGSIGLHKPLYLWVNEGLMSLFFFIVGLELKHEFCEGELSEVKNVMLPAICAVGGMVVPAVIYLLFNPTGIHANGWAIPAATDIAFALGVLSLFGRRVPSSLKIFLASLAIFDDIGAVIIIALFYTHNLSLMSLGIVFVCVCVLLVFNLLNVLYRDLYIIIGLIMWVALLKSGVHATLCGVLLAMFIPMKNIKNSNKTLLKMFENDLKHLVSFIVLPLFALVNAGIPVIDSFAQSLFHPISLGVFWGLFLGKQLGIASFAWLAIKTGIAKKPYNVSWSSLYGTSILCGIGFTMSLFIGSLAFTNCVNITCDNRVGILVGSLLSGIVGAIVLKYSLPKTKEFNQLKP